MSETTYFTKSIVVVVCLCSLCFPLQLFASESQMTNKQIEDLAAETEYTATEAEAAIEAVKEIRRELNEDIRKTQDILLTMQQKAITHFQRLSDLLFDEQGKILAQDPNTSGYATYLRLQEEPAVTVNEIISKQRRLIYLQRQVSLGAHPEYEVGYLPKKEIRVQITLLLDWAESTQKAFDGQVAALNQLLRWKPTRQLDTSQGPTLDQKVEERKAKWDRLLGILRLMAEDEIRPEVRKLLLEVYKDVEFEKGKLQAEIIEAREELSMARQRQQHEIAMQEDTFLLESTRKLADEDLKTRQVELDSKIREFAAARALEQALADRNINILETDTARQQLIARAESKDVQLLLRPFIAKGYWQPNRYNKGLERSGMSLYLIKYKGCLKPGIPGFTRLLSLGTNSRNKERGPWTFPTRISQLTEEQFEQLKTAQKYLIELGPTLVELGYLAP